MNQSPHGLRITISCQRCSKILKVHPYRKKQKFCSFSCRSKSQKRWKGKAIKAAFGYKRVWTGQKYVPEHRFIMEKHIGRKLKKSEVVHHINHKRSDNRLENLMVMKAEDHTHYHHKGRPKPKAWLACAQWHKTSPKCGKPITGWYKRPAGSPCQKAIPCPTH